MSPGTGVLVYGCSQMHIIKMYYFCKESSYLLLGIGKTNKVYSHNDQGRISPNRKFHGLWPGVLVQGCGHISKKLLCIISLEIVSLLPGINAKN